MQSVVPDKQLTRLLCTRNCCGPIHLCRFVVLRSSAAASQELPGVDCTFLKIQWEVWLELNIHSHEIYSHNDFHIVKGEKIRQRGWKNRIQPSVDHTHTNEGKFSCAISCPDIFYEQCLLDDFGSFSALSPQSSPDQDPSTGDMLAHWLGSDSLNFSDTGPVWCEILNILRDKGTFPRECLCFFWMFAKSSQVSQFPNLTQHRKTFCQNSLSVTLGHFWTRQTFKICKFWIFSRKIWHSRCLICRVCRGGPMHRRTKTKRESQIYTSISCPVTSSTWRHV